MASANRGLCDPGLFELVHRYKYIPAIAPSEIGPAEVSQTGKALRGPVIVAHPILPRSGLQADARRVQSLDVLEFLLAVLGMSDLLTESNHLRRGDQWFGRDTS